MGSYRIKRKPARTPTRPAPQAFDDDYVAESVKIGFDAAKLPKTERLRFVLASLSDGYLRQVNRDAPTQDASGSLAALAIMIHGGFEPVDEETMAQLIPLWTVLLCAEELRRAGLAIVEQGYADSILDESRVQIDLQTPLTGQRLSSCAQRLLLDVRTSHG